MLSDYCAASTGTVDDCDVTDDCVIDIDWSLESFGAGAGAECVQADLTGLSELFLQRTERGTYSSAEHTHLSVCRYSKFVPDAGRSVEHLSAAAAVPGGTFFTTHDWSLIGCVPWPNHHRLRSNCRPFPFQFWPFFSSGYLLPRWFDLSASCPCQRKPNSAI